MFGRHLKEENATLRTRLAAAEARCQELGQELEQSRSREEQARVHTNDQYAEQQQRFRALWFSGSDAVTDIREHLAASAGLLMDERQVLDSAQAVFQHSAETLAQMEGALKNIASDAEQNCEHISNLHSTAAEISKFVGVISEISEQTNLLALNAAIEAARAGDQGRGFAVVADEVRALAKKANEASAEITRLVGNISQRTTVANSDIRGMAEQSQQLVSSTQQVSDAVTEVVGLSQRMHGVVGRSAADSFIQTVKLDHVVWKTEVYKALLGLSSQPPESFADHTQCRLGKWYREGEGHQQHADHDAFRQLDAPHRGVHEHGIAALKRMRADDCDGALEELALMEQCSTRVIDLLGRLGDAIIRRQGE